MTFRYLNVREELVSEELGNYISFGICILKKERNKWFEEKFISDVCIDESVVETICKVAFSRQANSQSIYDIIELLLP